MGGEDGAHYKHVAWKRLNGYCELYHDKAQAGSEMTPGPAKTIGA